MPCACGNPLTTRKNAVTCGNPACIEHHRNALRLQHAKTHRYPSRARVAPATPTRWILALSGGKDSTAMLHVVLRDGLPLDEVVCYVSGWEFPELAAHLAQVEQTEHVTITRLIPEHDHWTVLNRWGWPHWRNRWCTGEMVAAFHRHNKGCASYIGIAADEAGRVTRYEVGNSGKARFPLVEAGLTTQGAMQLCLSRGYSWGGLYDYFRRFGCFCCPLMRVETMRMMRDKWPQLWQRMAQADAGLPDNVRAHGYKQGLTIAQWEDRFASEPEQDDTKARVAMGLCAQVECLLKRADLTPDRRAHLEAKAQRYRVMSNAAGIVPTMCGDNSLTCAAR